MSFLPSLGSKYATMNLHLVTHVITLHCPDPTHEIQKGVLYIYIAQKEVAK